MAKTWRRIGSCKYTEGKERSREEGVCSVHCVMREGLKKKKKVHNGKRRENGGLCSSGTFLVAWVIDLN